MHPSTVCDDKNEYNYDVNYYIHTFIRTKGPLWPLTMLCELKVDNDRYKLTLKITQHLYNRFTVIVTGLYTYTETRVNSLLPWLHG